MKRNLAPSQRGGSNPNRGIGVAYPQGFIPPVLKNARTGQNLTPISNGVSDILGIRHSLVQNSDSSNKITSSQKENEYATSTSSEAWRKSVSPPQFLQQKANMTDENVRYFNAVWCKQSTRKHKKWEGDALLVIKTALRLAILQDADSDGKEICRGSRLEISKLSSIENGSVLSFGGKDIEIMEEISEKQYQESIVGCKQRFMAEKKLQEQRNIDELAESAGLGSQQQFSDNTYRKQAQMQKSQEFVAPKFKPFVMPGRVNSDKDSCRNNLGSNGQISYKGFSLLNGKNVNSLTLSSDPKALTSTKIVPTHGKVGGQKVNLDDTPDKVRQKIRDVWTNRQLITNNLDDSNSSGNVELNTNILPGRNQKVKEKFQFLAENSVPQDSQESHTEFKPFVMPGRVNNDIDPCINNLITNGQRRYKAMFDPMHPDAIVMPRSRQHHSSSQSQPSQAMETDDNTTVDVVVDPHLGRQLRPHQVEGVLFLYKCIMGYQVDGSFGAILADEMGLGKTLQTIALIWTLLKQSPSGYGKSTIKNALILAPSSLVKNWEAEFTKWLGRERITVCGIDGSASLNEYIKLPLRGRAPVLILSYEMFTRAFTSIDEYLTFDLLVCDEGHRLKNSGGKASQYLASMSKTDKRIVLTGTPLQNDLKEFFSIVNVVCPGILGSVSQFTRRFEEPIRKHLKFI